MFDIVIECLLHFFCFCHSSFDTSSVIVFITVGGTRWQKVAAADTGWPE